MLQHKNSDDLRQIAVYTGDLRKLTMFTFSGVKLLVHSRCLKRFQKISYLLSIKKTFDWWQENVFVPQTSWLFSLMLEKCCNISLTTVELSASIYRLTIDEHSLCSWNLVLDWTHSCQINWINLESSSGCWMKRRKKNVYNILPNLCAYDKELRSELLLTEVVVLWLMNWYNITADTYFTSVK